MKLIADVVPTPDLVERMIRDRPVCWTWAAFASVLFQRWAALEERKVMQVLSAPVTPAGVLLEGPDVTQFVMEHIRGAQDAIAKFASLLADPAFAAAFGAPEGEHAADGPAIVAAAHVFGDGRRTVYQDARRREAPSWGSRTS